MALINFSGIASGIDSAALIEATSNAARQGRVVPLENKVRDYTDTNDALSEVKKKLQDLQTTVKAWATLNGGPLSKTATSSNEAYLTGAASATATNGSYSVTVSQLARNATQWLRSTDFTYTSTSAVINPDIDNAASATNRTVRVQIGQGTYQQTVDVAITNATTLSDFVSTFNSSTTYAQASVVNAGSLISPDYRIVITGTKNGENQGDFTVTIGSEIQNASLGSNRNAFDNNTLNDAQDASFSIGGVTITRGTNSVSDVISGVTFELKSAGTATLTIGDDADTSTATVQKFIDGFNGLVKYIKEKNLIERQESGSSVKNIFGALASTRVDDGILQAIRGAITSSSYSSGSQIKIFSDLGITTERDGTLKFNTDTFKSALSTEPASVNSVLQNFGNTAGLTGGTIDIYIRFNGLLDITLNSNKTSITDLNKRIAEAEAAILKREETMRAQFSRLESTIGRLQSQQSQLTSALSGLGK